MAISAKRFKFLDNETNIAIADFKELKTADIFNSPNNEVKELTDSMESFLKKTEELPIPKVEDLKVNLFDGVSDTLPSLSSTDVRGVKGLIGSIKDIANLTSKDLDKTIASLLPDNPLAQSAFGKLSSKCQKGALGKGGAGKPYKPTVSCNGHKSTAAKGACKSSDFGGILNKATGGQFNSSYKNPNSSLANLMGLSSFGFDLGLCGVFGALSGGLDKNILSRAAGGLLGDLASKGNVKGVIDLATDAIGLHSLIELPSGIGDVFKSFKLPSDVKDMDLIPFTESFTGSLDTFNPKWNTSGFDGLASIGGLDYNLSLDSTLNASIKNTNIDVNNLDTVLHMDECFTSVAYSSKPTADEMMNTITSFKSTATSVRVDPAAAFGPSSSSSSFFDNAINSLDGSNGALLDGCW